jgi:hypothetical protein
MSYLAYSFDANDPVTVNHVQPSAKDLAQEILSWIDRTAEEVKSNGKTLAVDRLTVLVDDIEELCKKHLESTT